MLAVLMSGIDTLKIAYFGPLRSEVRDLLEGPRSQTAGARPTHALPIDVEGSWFQLMPYGNRKGRYILQNDDLRATVAEYSSGQFPSLYLELGSSFLWREGAPKAVETVRGWSRRILASLDRELISRADLAVDYQGWGPQIDDAERYVCRSPRRSLHLAGQKCTGLQFGKGDIVARHYNKTLEISVTRKPWFQGLWGRSSAYAPSEPVSRLEFQFRRGALTSFRPRIDSFDDLWDRRGSMWRYGADRWLTFRDAPPGVRRDHWPVHPVWRILQAQGFPDQEAPLVRERKRQAKLEQLTPQLTGALSSVAALLGTDQLDITLQQTGRLTRNYLGKRGILFETLVAEKRARFAQMTEATR